MTTVKSTTPKVASQTPEESVLTTAGTKKTTSIPNPPTALPIIGSAKTTEGNTITTEDYLKVSKDPEIYSSSGLNYSLLLIGGAIGAIFFLCCLVLICKLKKKKKKEKNFTIEGDVRPGKVSALDCEILDEINRNIDDDKSYPEVVISDLTAIMGRLSPDSTESRTSSRCTEDLPSRASTARLVLSPSPATSPLGTDWRQMWDSTGNWSSYADDQAFWKTRLSDQTQDTTYSSVDWIIKDIMASYPTSERANREQVLKKEKMSLISALNTSNPAEEMQHVELLKNGFISSVEHFLTEFSSELDEDDVSFWRNEMDDVRSKVQTYQDDSRGKARLDYMSKMLDPKATKLETIMELCKEIDQASGVMEENRDVATFKNETADDKKTSETIQESRSSTSNSCPYEDFLTRLELEDGTSRREEKRGKTVVSYSVQKQVTEIMTVTQE